MGILAKIFIVLLVISALGTIAWCSWLTSRMNRLSTKETSYEDLVYNLGVSLGKIENSNAVLQNKVAELESKWHGQAIQNVWKFSERNRGDLYMKCTDDSDCGEDGVCSESGCTIGCKRDEDCSSTLPDSLTGIYSKCLDKKCAPITDPNASFDVWGKKREVSKSPGPQLNCFADPTFGRCIANCKGLEWDGTNKNSSCVYASPNPKK